MTDAIDELERLLETATPGKWRVRIGPGEKLQVVCGGNPPDAGIADFGYDLGDDWPATNNAKLVVAAHNRMPALLAYVRALEAVEAAARARREVWTRETYVAVDAALSALDAARAKLDGGYK